MIEAAFSLVQVLSPAATDDAPASDNAVDALILEATTADLVQLEAALGLRLAQTPVSRSDRARKPKPGELFAYLEVAPDAGDRVTLRLTLGDARAWVRPIDAPPVDRTREIATTVANLIAGIEADAIAPDLRDVPLPAPLQPTTTPEPQPVTTTTTPEPPAFEWGIGVEGGVLLAVGPPPPSGLAGGTVALRSAIRWRRGALLTFAARGGFDRARDYGMTRIRVDVGGGYAWHRSSFALHTTLAATIEPWFVTRGGAIGDGDPRPVGVLLGGELRIAPMWHRRVGARALMLGPFLTAGGSGLATGDGGVARLRASDGGPAFDLFRAGGLELGAGVTLALWSPSKRRATKPRSESTTD